MKTKIKTQTFGGHGFFFLSLSYSSLLGWIHGILSVVPDQARQTRTCRFLGLANNFGLWPNSDYDYDDDVVIRDTGIWPEIPSFSDEGLSPVPSGRDSDSGWLADDGIRACAGRRATIANKREMGGSLDEVAIRARGSPEMEAIPRSLGYYLGEERGGKCLSSYESSKRRWLNRDGWIVIFLPRNG
ncbi:hypothetical protein TIFTF001_022552 [Ficus carica]|uniref:Uncharacterized protein n=1 Tax=Ficus carica TaxID=3494 RepID=A0AA88DEL5_FICCA|nr:hypothetical protein TIFTF001_022552 [Ficus carica]